MERLGKQDAETTSCQTTTTTTTFFVLKNNINNKPFSGEERVEESSKEKGIGNGS